MGFIEVVDAEEELPFGGAVEAEVEQMGIAAELHHQARMGLAAEIGCHHDGGAAEEREGALRHAPVALRHEPGQTLSLLLFQELQRIQASTGVHRWPLPARAGDQHRRGTTVRQWTSCELLGLTSGADFMCSPIDALNGQASQGLWTNPRAGAQRGSGAKMGAKLGQLFGGDGRRHQTQAIPPAQGL